METGGPTHELLRIETVAGRGHRARCTCGWESVVATSPGVAGGLWDDHVAEVDA